MVMGSFMPLSFTKEFKWVNTLVTSLNENTGSWANYTLRQIVGAGALTVVGGNRIRVTVKAPTNTALQLRNAFIGIRAASGWAFSSTPTQMINVAGGDGAVIAASGVAEFEAAFSIPTDASLVFSTYIISGNLRRRLAAGASFPSYYKTGDSAGEVNPSSYTSEGTNLLAIQSVDIRV